MQERGGAVGLERGEVTLANGECVSLHMTTAGSMVTSDQTIEPIVPMGLLIDLLGCEVSWSKGMLQLKHPQRGTLPVEDCNGCPQVSKKLALELITEFEDAKRGARLDRISFEEEVQWKKQLIALHPVFSSLPSWLKDRLVVEPAGWDCIPANRRQRRTMRREGFVLHLYSGEEDGYTLKRSLKGQGGRDRLLLEIDKKHGSGRDMTKDSDPYSSLLRAALEQKLLAVIGGPNCRTRSVLCHRPIEGQPDAPRPIRSWGGGGFGASWATPPKERALLEEDDLLMWRMLFLFMVAEYTRKAQLKSDPIHLVLEQPASQKAYKPEVVSLWDTGEWQSLRKEFQLKEVTFNQGKLGGLPQNQQRWEPPLT